MRLPDPLCSRAVLIGTSTYVDPSLPDIPAIETTIDTLATALTDLDFGPVRPDPQHCVTMVNEGDLREIGTRLGDAAEEATDLLFVYYAGRVLVDRRTRALHLGLPDSDPKRPGFNSLEYSILRDTVLDSRALMKIIVLDSRFPDGIADLGDRLTVKGGYVVAASFGDEAEAAPIRQIHSAFSGHLISILRDGIQGGPGLLRVDDVHQHLVNRMRREGLPDPEARGSYAYGPLALMPNRGSFSAPLRIIPEKKPQTPAPAAPAEAAAPEKRTSPEEQAAALVIEQEPRSPEAAPAARNPSPVKGPSLRDDTVPLIKTPRPFPDSASHPDALPGEDPATVTAVRAAPSLDKPAERPANVPSADEPPCWFGEPMLEWAERFAERLTESAAPAASVLLARAAASVEPESERYAWFASRLAQALFRAGELDRAQDFVNLALDRTDDADVRVHLQSTLAQCLDKGGSPKDALNVLGRALGAPGLTARHRAGLLVLAARSHNNLSEFGKATEIASEALKAAKEAGDESAADWALNIISMARAMTAANTDFAKLQEC